MGREVRRVPANWQHPKDELTGHYKPLFPGEDYPERAKDWKDGYAAWERGERPDYMTSTSREDKGLEYWEYHGNPPHRDDYMPNWPEAERTHLMMYEDTSEGTPISPAFATPEELARWLADNGASAFGRSTATYEQWLATCRGAWAPSMVISGGRALNGVEFAAQTENRESGE